MYQTIKRISPMLLCLAVLLIQSCSTPQQAVKPVVPTVPDPNEITVFYDSDPPGALLYELGKNVKLGETPFWVVYRLSDAELQQGGALLDPTRVVWPSGASASNHPGVYFELKKGRGQTYVFSRPDVPGGEADYEVGLKRMMHRIEKGESK